MGQRGAGKLCYSSNSKNRVIPAKHAPACFKVGAGIRHTHDIRCLDGLDPSLRWDDGFEGFLDVRIQMTKKSKQQRV